jgi:hypothetical protein
MRNFAFTCALLTAAACGGSHASPPSAGGADTSAAATLIFKGDFSPPDAVVVPAGAVIEVLWDRARLSAFQCAEGGGGINPRWTVDGGPELDASQGPSYPDRVLDGHTYEDVTFLSPSAGHDLALWFVLGDRYGQCGVDSNQGGNYHFQLGGAGSATSGPVATFNADWTLSLSGQLKHGGSLQILWDNARLSAFQCSEGGGGINPQWSVDGGPQLNEGAGQVSSGPPVSRDGHVYQDVTIWPLPASGGQLALWFILGDRYGQCGTDSAGGANYPFQLE